MITAQFLLTSLIIVLIPGTGVILTISAGLTRGRLATVYVALGCTVGIVPHLVATIFGLAALLHSSAVAFQTLKFAGVAYLFYLALSTWRDRAAISVDETLVSMSPARLIIRAFLPNILNPKLSIFFVAFLPQFVPADTTAPLANLLVLSGVFMLMTLVVFLLYGQLAHAFRAIVLDSPRVQTWLRRSFGAAFAALGIDLALSQR